MFGNNLGEVLRKQLNLGDTLPDDQTHHDNFSVHTRIRRSAFVGAFTFQEMLYMP